MTQNLLLNWKYNSIQMSVISIKAKFFLVLWFKHWFESQCRISTMKIQNLTRKFNDASDVVELLRNRLGLDQSSREFVMNQVFTCITRPKPQSRNQIRHTVEEIEPVLEFRRITLRVLGTERTIRTAQHRVMVQRQSAPKVRTGRRGPV